MGTSFLTDGKQIIFHFNVIREKLVPVHTLQTLQNSEELRTYANSSKEQYLYPEVNFPDHGTFGQVEITRVIAGDPGQQRIIRHIVYEKNNGLFGKNAAYRTKGDIPRVIAGDPGQKNFIRYSVYDRDSEDPKREAVQLVNLTRGEYRQKSGQIAFLKWINKRKRCIRIKLAEEILSENSLKGVRKANFNNRFLLILSQYDVMSSLYASKGFARQRFLYETRKQRFDAKFTNKCVDTFKRETNLKPFVVAYGDGNFPLSMKGMVGGGSSHKRLMMLLSKRVRVVMTDEYRTTHACPHCRENAMDLSMIHPKGKEKYYNRTLDKYIRKKIHGLSHCAKCKKLWSRDYAATLNIARSFEHYFFYGERIKYLSR